MKRLSARQFSAQQSIISGDPVNLFGIEIPRDVLLLGGVGLGVAVVGVVMNRERSQPPSRDTQGADRIVVVR